MVSMRALHHRFTFCVQRCVVYYGVSVSDLLGVDFKTIQIPRIGSRCGFCKARVYIRMWGRCYLRIGMLSPLRCQPSWTWEGSHLQTV